MKISAQNFLSASVRLGPTLTETGVRKNKIEIFLWFLMQNFLYTSKYIKNKKSIEPKCKIFVLLIYFSFIVDDVRRQGYANAIVEDTPATTTALYDFLVCYGLLFLENILCIYEQFGSSVVDPINTANRC